MSDAGFEAYLALLARFLRLSSRQRDEIRRELRAHLEEAVESEMAAGQTREDAILNVLDDFGDAAELAARFRSIGWKRRWIMRGTLAAACIGIAAITFHAIWPEAGPATADQRDSAVGVAAHGAAPDSVNQLTERAVETGRAQAATDAEIYARLQAVLPEVRFEEFPLAETIAYLRDAIGVNVHVYWEDLEAQGVARDKPVTIRLQRVSGQRVLDLLLDDAGAEMPLGFDVHDGVLVIASREKLERERYFTTRVYDVRDLLELAQRWACDTSATRTARSTGESGAPEVSAAGGATPPTADAAPSPAEARLAALIRDTIAPESWRENGGPGGLNLFNGAMVVRHSNHVQREIERLLAGLREAGGDTKLGYEVRDGIIRIATSDTRARRRF
jgi:hypothetical protein